MSDYTPPPLATPVSLANGGFGASNASTAAALTSIGAAASGANSDITSLTGVTGGARATPAINFGSSGGSTNVGVFRNGTDGELVSGGNPFVTWNTGGATLRGSGGSTAVDAGNQVLQYGGTVVDWNGCTLANPNARAGGWGVITGGTASTYARIGGIIFDYYTDGASTSTDGTEDTLKTSTLPASTFGANGDKISGYFQLAIVGHAVSTDRIRLYAAGTAIFDTAALNFPLTAALTVAFEIVRVSSSVIRASCFATTTSATLIPYSQFTEITSLTLSNTQIVAIKDISTGTNSAASDVTVKQGKILWQPAAA